MIVNGMNNGMNKNAKGMSKEERIGIALGAVAFILVLVFFLVLGNMSHVPAPAPAPAPAPQVPSAPVAVIQSESSGLGFGDMLLMMGGVVLLIGFWVVANRFGWLSIEMVSEASEASAEIVIPLEQGRSDDLPQEAEISEQIKLLTLDLARKELIIEKLNLDLTSACSSLAALKEQFAGQTAKVSELTRDMSRRHQTIQRLSKERRQMGEQFEALRTLLSAEKDESLAEKVTEVQGDLAAALTAKKELTARLKDSAHFREVTEKELEEFWPTLVLDKKSFMSKRRQDRLLSRMRAEKMVIVRK